MPRNLNECNRFCTSDALGLDCDDAFTRNGSSLTASIREQETFQVREAAKTSFEFAILVKTFLAMQRLCCEPKDKR